MGEAGSRRGEESGWEEVFLTAATYVRNLQQKRLARLTNELSSCAGKGRFLPAREREVEETPEQERESSEGEERDAGETGGSTLGTRHRWGIPRTQMHHLRLSATAKGHLSASLATETDTAPLSGFFSPSHLFDTPTLLSYDCAEFDKALGLWISVLRCTFCIPT